VKGKANCITVDQCKKSAVVFDDLIASCEFVNCQSVKAQANGTVNTISIDKTDGINVYLNESNKTAQLVSAKSSEMNVSVVDSEGDLTEYPLPEQYVSEWDAAKKTFVTSVMLSISNSNTYI
jgi:adenylyl cyclase-associated protein